MARRLADGEQDLSHLVLVMMDEYLVPIDGRLTYASASHPWSCHHFARAEIADRLNAGLPAEHRIRDGAIWFPDPADPQGYDARIASAGGIGLFLLARRQRRSCRLQLPGSPRDSRTRVVPLSEDTRRDNVLTFPHLGVSRPSPATASPSGSRPSPRRRRR